MRRLSRSILVLSVVVALNAPAAQARVINDDGDLRTPITRIVKAVRQFLQLIWDPCDDGGDLVTPKP